MTRRVARSARAFLSVRGAVALLVSGGGLGLLIRRQAAAGAKVTELSRLLGLQAERLISLQRAAQNEGIQIRQTNLAVQRLVRRYGDAVGGQKQLQQAFADLGVELRNADGSLRSTDDLLADVADGLAGTRDPALRLSRAFKLFDSEGARFALTLIKGSAALEEQRRQLEAHRAAVELQNEKLKALEQAFTDVGRTLTDEVQRAIAGNAEEINFLIRGVGALTATFVRFASQGGSGLQTVTNHLRILPSLINDARTAFRQLLTPVFAISAAIGAAVEQAGRLSDFVSGTPPVGEGGAPPFGRFDIAGL